jgi:hypothetical protein
MTLERKLVEIRYYIFEGVSSFFDFIATKFFNYPENPGMPIDEPFFIRKDFLLNILINCQFILHRFLQNLIRKI